MDAPQLSAPDVERIFPRKIYEALSVKYPRLFTDRAAPANLDGRPVVVCYRQGGLSKGLLFDQPRLAVDVYAPTELMVNDLARDVRAVIESLRGHDPVITVTATGPSPIEGQGRGPQRRFYADALTRKRGT